MINELARSAAVRGFAWLEHFSPEVARGMATRHLDADLDDGPEAVLMMDDDQAVEQGPSDPSWIDRIVGQYASGDPYRILFGVTAIDHSRRAWNFELEEDGKTVRWAGTGLMFIPRLAWRRIRERHSSPWWLTDAGDIGKGEDILFCRRARELGILLEPIRDITIGHWPRWRHGMVARTDADGLTSRILPTAS